MSPPPKLSRRTLTIGGIAAGGVAIVAGAIYEVPRLLKHRASGEYADLVNLLGDPEKAAVVGRAIEQQAARFGAFDSVVHGDPVAWLRKKLLKQTLEELTIADAKQGLVAEVDGWVMPATQLFICELAADPKLVR
jgi:hypothetical protein